MFDDIAGKIKTWAVLTPENPMAQRSASEENSERRRRFKELIRRMYIQYIPVEGHYGNSGHSFMLFNVRLSDAEVIAGLFNQKSFFFAETSEESDCHRVLHIVYYEKSDGSETYRPADNGRAITSFKKAGDYFTRHGNFEFSIQRSAFESYMPVKDMDSLEKSLEENRTGFSAAMHRLYSYKEIHNR